MSTLRHYRAPTLAEAASQIKSELGGDAVIVDTRTVRKGSLFGRPGEPMVEVTVQAPEPAKSPPAVRSSDAGQLLAAEVVRRDLDAIRTMLHQLQQTEALREFPPETRDLYRSLRQQGVSEQLALRLMHRARLDRQVPDPAACRHLLRQQIIQQLGEPVPITVRRGEGRLVALIGSTGVGKTTTLAKLAVHFARECRLRVGVITLDSQRIGAEAQLATYCDLIGVPLLVAETTEEAVEARQSLAGCDLILADTAGRGPRDGEQIATLREQLGALAPQDLCLVLSLTTSEADAQAVAEALAPLGPTRLIATKLDETSLPGTLLNLRVACRLPVSYVGTGQRVPGDLQLVDPGAYCLKLLQMDPGKGGVHPW